MADTSCENQTGVLTLSQSGHNIDNDMDQLDKMADIMVEGGEETPVIQALSCLSQKISLEAWYHDSSGLNLLQLAVMHRQTLVVEFLCSHHPRLMDSDLYILTDPSPPPPCAENLAQSPPVEGSADCRTRRAEPSSETRSGDSSDVSCGSASAPEVPPPLQSGVHPEESGAGQSGQLSSQPPPSTHSPAVHLDSSGEGRGVTVTNTSDGERQVQSSLKSNPSCAKDHLLNHPLHMACATGDLPTLKALTASATTHTSLFSSKTKQDGKMKEAASKGANVSATIQQLKTLMKTVSVVSRDDTPNPMQGLPLELAVDSGSVDCVVFLLLSVLFPWLSKQHHGLFLGVSRQAVPLHLSCCFSCPSLVRFLLSSLPARAVQCRDTLGHSPLHLALWTGDTHTLRLLLERGAPVNTTTSDGAYCFHILFRSKLTPHNMEANTRLLLEYGADLTATDCGQQQPHQQQCRQHDQALTPLHVLAEEICSTNRSSVFMWNRNVVKSLSAYARSTWEESSAKWTDEDYMRCLVRCLHLLLTAGADPNALDAPPPRGRTVMQYLLMAEQPHLRKLYADHLHTALSSLLHYGATLGQLQDFGDVNHFLLNNINELQKQDKHVQFLRLFCENGVSPACIYPSILPSRNARSVNANATRNPNNANIQILDTNAPQQNLGANPSQSIDAETALSLNLPALNWLGGRMSVGELSQLAATLSLNGETLPEGLREVVSALYGTPVHSLRHCSKVAVWKALGYQGRRVECLPVPDMVKDFLKSDSV